MKAAAEAVAPTVHPWTSVWEGEAPELPPAVQVESVLLGEAS